MVFVDLQQNAGQGKILMLCIKAHELHGAWESFPEMVESSRRLR